MPRSCSISFHMPMFGATPLMFCWYAVAHFVDTQHACLRRDCGIRQLVIDDATELLASEAAVAGRKSVSTSGLNFWTHSDGKTPQQGARKAHHRLHEFKKAMETAFRHVLMFAGKFHSCRGLSDELPASSGAWPVTPRLRTECACQTTGRGRASATGACALAQVCWSFRTPGCGALF